MPPPPPKGGTLEKNEADMMRFKNVAKKLCRTKDHTGINGT